MQADAADFPAEVTQAADLALESKGHGVLILDLRGISTATDYFVLASGTSDVQVKAIAEHVVDELKKENVRPAHVEGLSGGRWVLLDYIDFVVHVFTPDVREFYGLEQLWGSAERLEVDESEAAE